jgi:hypothetical protein
MTAMTESNFLDRTSHWTIALYERIEPDRKNYQQAGVFFEGQATTSEAYEMFSELCDAAPTWQVIERTLQLSNLGIAPKEYEVRMFNASRYVASFIWSAEDVAAATKELPPRKKFRLEIEVDLFDFESATPPEGWDWDELFLTDRAKLICADPPLNDIVEPESSEGEDNDKSL